MKKFIVLFFIFVSCFAYGQAESPAVFSFQSLVDWTNYRLDSRLLSAGATVEPTYTYNSIDNTIDLNACCVSLYNNPEFVGAPKQYDFDPINLQLLDSATNYVVADYNLGTPTLRVTQDVEEINESTIVPILTIYVKNDFVHTLNWNELGRGLSNKIHQRLVKTNRYAYESGLAVSAHDGLKFTIQSGVVWYGAKRQYLTELLSDLDTASLVYPNGDVTPITQFNNTQYMSGNTLVTVTNNRYVVNWLYRGIEEEKHAYIMLGMGDYSLSDAINAEIPAAPPIITSHARLVAKVIVLKDALTPHTIQSAFDQQFRFASPVVHNDLSGLNVGDFQHLTSAEKIFFDNIDSNYVATTSYNIDQALKMDTDGSNAAAIVTLSDIEAESVIINDRLLLKDMDVEDIIRQLESFNPEATDLGTSDWTLTTFDTERAFNQFSRAFTSVSSCVGLATYTDGPTHGRGSDAFRGGVLLPSGKVAMIPHNSPNIGIYDPVADTYTDGPTHGRGAYAFKGGVLLPSGKVAMVPNNSPNIGIYDPVADTYTDGPTHRRGYYAFRGGVLLPSGKVAMIPFRSTNIGIYDPVAGTYTDGPTHRRGDNAFIGGVLLPSGKVVMVPGSSTNIGIYDPVAGTYTDGPTHGQGTYAFTGGVLLPSGKVVMVPRHSTNIGIYDPVAGTYTDGPTHGQGTYAFTGGVLLPSGKVAMIPRRSTNVGIYESYIGSIPISNLLTPFVNKF